AIKLRHARGRRSRPRRERKHVKVRQSALADQIERAPKHLLGLGGKTSDDIGAEYHVRAQAAQRLAKLDGILARVPALHALENEIVAGLERQMQMRHQPVVLRESVNEIAIGLD